MHITIEERLVTVTLTLTEREALVVEHALYLAGKSTAREAKSIRDEAHALQAALNDELDFGDLEPLNASGEVDA